MPGLSRLPLTDRDEALFVQASRQMLETGNWIDIHFQDEPRYKKPVGIYWLQGAAAELSGDGAEAPLWVYRLPSLIGALLTVLLTFLIAERLSGSTAGLIAGALAAMTVELAFEARIGKTDAALCASIAASQLAVAMIWTDPTRRQHFWRNALFWTALGVGILIKGPVAPMVIGLTLVSLMVMDRSLGILRALSPLYGASWLLIIVLPWLIAIGWISGGAFFRDSVGKDMLGKVGAGQEGHGALPGTHLLIAIGTFWPLSAFAPVAFVWGWRNRAEAVSRFAFAWGVPAWIVCELVATKLPNYVLPMMPALAVLAGVALAQAGLEGNRRLNRLWYFHIVTGALLIGIGLNVLVYHVQGTLSPWGILLGSAVILTAFLSWRFCCRDRLKAAMAALCLTGVIAYALAYAVLLPAADQLWLSDRIADAAKRDAKCASPQIVIVGYYEPSTVFRLGTNILRTDPETGAQAFLKATCAFAAVEERQMADFQASLTTAGQQMSPIDTVQGRNINGFKLRIMRIFAK
ncbi:ArnT family glycosyltransferase [Oryzifoliimicrobium ureilyticus]|uniref:ArnT family glycosyltransferase n=1 Tax=Oryzifoliimicrobium ureilyticus TaxID=3113724 RepID=UPI0030766D7A